MRLSHNSNYIEEIKKMLKFQKNKKGFTLIEVLLVIVIIGVLAAIAIPRFMTSKHDAQVKACDAQISEFRTQIEKYYFDNNSYPATLAALVADTNYYPNGGATTCPLNNAAYTYTVASGTVVCPATGH